MIPQAPGGRIRGLGLPRISSGALSRLPDDDESSSSPSGIIPSSSRKHAMTHETFRVETRVYWGDTDMATIMNMPRAFDFANAAIEDFYHAILGFGFR
jgi:hypothetical protein